MTDGTATPTPTKPAAVEQLFAIMGGFMHYRAFQTAANWNSRTTLQMVR
jgi:hypothetical protein